MCNHAGLEKFPGTPRKNLLPHVQVGWPLGTTLVCLLDNELYAGAMDKASDFMVKQLKNKEWRGTALKCVTQLVTSYLVRYGRVMPRSQVNLWLERQIKVGNLFLPCLAYTCPVS